MTFHSYIIYILVFHRIPDTNTWRSSRVVFCWFLQKTSATKVLLVWAGHSLKDYAHCKLHVLQVVLVVNCTCCKLHTLQIAHVAKLQMCNSAKVQICYVANLLNSQVAKVQTSNQVPHTHIHWPTHARTGGFVGLLSQLKMKKN